MKYFLIMIFILVCSSVSAGQKLVWDASSNSLLSGYNVYIGTDSRFYGDPIDVGMETEYVITNPAKDERLFYAVTAYDTDGNESFLSEEVVYFPVTISNIKIILEISSL